MNCVDMLGPVCVWVHVGWIMEHLSTLFNRSWGIFRYHIYRLVFSGFLIYHTRGGYRNSGRGGGGGGSDMNN